MNQKALNQFPELTYTEQVSVVGGDLSVEVIMKGIFTGIFDAGYHSKKADASKGISLA